MLSKKMTVSLMSLITIFALAFAVPGALADTFDVTVSTHNTDYRYASAASGTEIPIRIMLTSAQPVTDAAALGALTLTAYTAAGASATSRITTALAVDNTYNNTPTKKRFTFTVTPSDGGNPATVVAEITLDVDELTSSDLRIKDKGTVTEGALTFTFTQEAPDTIPKVISIQRLRPGSQTVVAAFQEQRIDLSVFPTFDVRIVLSAAHTFDPATAANLVEVDQGTPSGLVIGAPFAWQGGTTGESPPVPNSAQAIKPHPSEGHYYFANDYGPLLGRERRSTQAADTVPMPTAADDMYRQYRVTITPFEKSGDFDVKVRVKSFHDGGSPIRNTYIAPEFKHSSTLPNGRDILTIPVKGAARPLTAGYKVRLNKDIVIPAGGYLVIANDKDGSKVEYGPGPAGDWRINDTPRPTHRTPEQLKYNVIDEGNLKDELPNLATQFLTGVVVDVESQHAGLVVSEVMWGEDVSLVDRTHSQYIELYNPGAQYKTVDDKDETKDINEALTLIFYAPNEFTSVPPAGTDGSLPTGITDRIGTLYGKGDYWNPSTKGQSGSSGVPLQNATDVEVTIARTAVTKIVSMYRVMEADDTIDATMGQMAAKWASSEGPKSTNFKPVAIGIRHGTPGAATDATETPADTAADAAAIAAAAAAAQKKIDSTGTIPTAGQIYISEIMFAGAGSLPQWIEIANGSATEDINLSGWTLKIENANSAVPGPRNVGSTITFTIPDETMIDRSRQMGTTKTPSTILVVSETGRHDLGKGAGQVVNLMKESEVELILAGVTGRRYTLLSDEAFKITLAPPAYTATKLAATATAAQKAEAKAKDALELRKRVEATDMVGNLSADGTALWELPTNADGGRSSIIRAHVNVDIGPSEPEGGMMEGNWVLASDTAFKDDTHISLKSYYGAASDVGTPGFRTGGALPVELSHFRPTRDKATGQVTITWSTQSELNNAGFFIKRSNQKDGEFKVINATMIAGAGTTSEKQFYTYTDTTAQPNVVYYYQIEDVSLDGNRQTLTRGIRLKGHVGAAGKATTLWGELKTSHE